MNEMEQKLWDAHEKRLNESSETSRDISKALQRLEDNWKQLTERVNEGVAKTQQKILDKDAQIELQLKDLKHDAEIRDMKVHDRINLVEAELIKKIDPLQQTYNKIDRVYWLILAALIVMIVGFFGPKIIDKLLAKDETGTTHVENLKAQNVKTR